MNFPMRAAKEIFDNPSDLEISIYRTYTDLFGLTILRGPTGKSRVVVIFLPVFQEQDHVLYFLEKFLEDIVTSYTESIKSLYKRRGITNFEISSSLDDELILRIVRELKKNNSAKTWQMVG